ncbi:hypothetical protein FVEN_g6018 [Fusarium venenatum]|uniref:Uncharacterized protein n=1 Tax=Fusarium venenatum TaxID=56646 RepID=A0A2L2SWW8_9HYPO|nr:uncharacterized protein FVRRES_05694 [Fusarium venenatum]KAG8356293.1 hypothetical protein FVEN_g6018 [Fusarium venenatum]KAH6992753.1 hypothetical protein EDB82DRAFT_523843 [Fusarium venenatum]CEI61258.1 unnamed protein product [Fusarium venenatum]
MSNQRNIAASGLWGKGKHITKPAPALKGILKLSQNTPSSPDTSRHIKFCRKADTIVYIPSKNRGRRPSRRRDDWVIVSRPGEKYTASRADSEITSYGDVMDFLDEDCAAFILSEPFEHACIRLQRHLQHDSKTDRK